MKSFYCPIANTLEKKTWKFSYHNILKRIKYAGIKKSKEVKDFYNENIKFLKKQDEKDTRIPKATHVWGLV